MDGGFYFAGSKRSHGGGFTRFVMKPKTAPTPRGEAALARGHPALAEARTVFPTRVFNASERHHVLIPGENNAKIGKRVTRGRWFGMPIYTFALEERATCPKSCGLWAECYGNALPLAVRFRYGAELMAALDVELRHKATLHPGGFVVRLHVLGDFPDMAYLEWWARWMREIPQIHVWGYTAHSPMSDIGRHVSALNGIFPDRWAFRFSLPPDASPGPMQVTTTWDAPDRNHAAGGIVCPAETGAVPACGACGMCWEPAHAARRVAFLGHGMRKRPRPVVMAQREEAPVMVPTTIKLEFTITGGTEALTDLVQRLVGVLSPAASATRPPMSVLPPPSVGVEKSDMPAPESEGPAASPPVKTKREISAAGLEALRARAAHARAVAAAKRAERGPPPIEPAAPKISIEPRPPSPPLASPTAPERNLAQMMSTLGTVRVTAAPKPTPAPAAQEPPKKPQPPMSRTEALRRVADAGARRVAAADGPPPAALSVIRTSWPEIKRIAYEEGYPLTDFHSMQAYNRSRERRGLPIFALSPPKAHA